MSKEIVWKSTLDDKYECIVKRSEKKCGRLIVTNTETKEIILDKEVDLSYGAQFGPDIMDIVEWQDMIVDTIDNRKI
jgi:hypothetical protein